jgi:hypothetical protein
VNDTPGVVAARQAHSSRCRQRVITALDQASKQGFEISISAIARRAGVDRSFLYRHRDLHAAVLATAATHPPVAQRARQPVEHPSSWTSPTLWTGTPDWLGRTPNFVSDYPSGSANRPGKNPDSARPTTSTASTGKSPSWNNTLPSSAASLQTARTSSTQQEPPTVS